VDQPNILPIPASHVQKPGFVGEMSGVPGGQEALRDGIPEGAGEFLPCHFCDAEHPRFFLSGPLPAPLI
jgi:hypothetical protein